jgi:hypothetical protein
MRKALSRQFEPVAHQFEPVARQFVCLHYGLMRVSCQFLIGCICFVVILAAVSGFAPASLAAGATENGWQLAQQSQIYGPSLTLTVSPRGFKWVNDQSHLTVSSAPPDWNVYVYNDKTNSLYSTPIEKFHGVAGGAFSFVSEEILVNPTLIDGGTGSAFGWKVQFYKIPSPGQPRVGSEYRNRVDKGLYVLAQCPVPKQVGALVARCYNLPVAPGVPIRFDFINDHNGKEIMLRTMSVKMVKTSAATFMPPKGMKVTKSDRDVVIDRDGKAGMDQWLRDLDDPREHKPAAKTNH